MNQAAATIKKVLLAEDDEDDYLLFRDAVHDYSDGLQLEWVKDGEELMQTLMTKQPQLPELLFLDINMPRKNGFECLTEIRNDSALANLPVIIFSTSNDKALVNWMYNAGANLYLCKPTEFEKLKSSIHKAIGMDWEKQTPYSELQHFVLE